jgi:hypothetical protein
MADKPKGLAVGRVVHYVSPRKGVHQASIVTEVVNSDNGLICLAVFDPQSRSTHYVDDVSWDATGERRGSWHYLEYVE